MLPIVTLTTHLLLLMSLISGIPSVDPLITCEAGTFTAGEPASVICNFRTNITATRGSIAMTRWPPHAPSHSTGEDVLLCLWLFKEKKYDCSVEMANYTFDGALTDHLTVRIPAVSAEQAGLYMCFFVSPEETPTHSCELRVQARPNSTTTTITTTSIPLTIIKVTDKEEEGEDLLPIILPCVFVIVAVMMISVGVLAFLRRRRTNSSSGTGNNVELPEIPESSEPLLYEPINPDSTTKKKSKMETLLGDFQLTNLKLQQLMTILNYEMAKGINEATRCEADIKMFPTFVSPLSEGSGNGNCLVLDLSNTRLKASRVKLQDKNARILMSAECPIPCDRMHSTVSQLFHFVAYRTNEFIKDFKFSGNLPLALIVDFPCKHESVDKGFLVKRNKEVIDSGTENGDLHTLLAESLLRCAQEMNSATPRGLDKLRKLKITAVVNDAVSTLVSVAFNNSNCKIGLVLDSGFNACYVEDWTYGEMENSTGEKPREMIINTELGALGENGCLDFCRTEFDKELDKHSSSSGSQILEKMVGGMYIGEIVRLVLEGMTKSHLLFHKVPLTCDLFQRDSFSTGCVIKIEGDTEEPYEKTSGVLDRLGVTDYTEDDLKTVRLACSTVCERAAYLAAASLASLINHIDQPEVTVVVDGYLYQSHPRFHDLMYSKTLELINPGLKFHLESPICDRAVGAARIAVASVRSRNKQSSRSSFERNVTF